MAVRKQPLRKCLGCGEMLGKKGLLRVVKAAGEDTNEISLDLTGKKSGRGAYICRDAECFKQARKKKSLERSLKCAIPDGVYDALLAEIESFDL